MDKTKKDEQKFYILGTQNWKQSQVDSFLAKKMAILGKYLYVDNVDEIREYAHTPHELHIPASLKQT